MQVAFYLAGEITQVKESITQVKESIPWVRCASGNVFFVNPKVKSRYNCYMLLGYDILIDANLQPHLIGES